MEIQNPRIVLDTGVLVDEETGHIIWPFFWLVYNNNLSIFVFIFKNLFFSVNTHKNLPILADFFWSAVWPFGRARSNFSLFCRHFGKISLVNAHFLGYGIQKFSHTLRLLEP